MFWRMVKGAILRQKGKMMMIAVTIALGTSLATSMLNVMLDVGDKVNKELKTYGANINVVPKEASLLRDLYGMEEENGIGSQYLSESELGKIKTIFWAFNIVDFAPYLEMKVSLNGGTSVKLTGTWFDNTLELPTGESLTTGMKRMKNWWEVSGEWGKDNDQETAMVGITIANGNHIAVGDIITVKYGTAIKKLTVSGIFDAGSNENEQIFVTLKTAQGLIGKENIVSRVEVSALTTPDNELSRRAAQNPKSLSIKEWETWYCTAYVSAICYQIDEVISNSIAKPIRQVAESEGAILEKTQLLMLLITILSLIGAALGISNLVTASVMERSTEIGLFKAVGAHNMPITRLVLTEILITGIIGGAVGYFAGLGFAQIIGQSVFDSAIDIKPMVLPLVGVLVFIVTLVGSIPSIRLLLHLHPAEVLHGGRT
ncbi:MAG: ABC transporter permease [Fusobacteriaceae bacterium]|jgi:putative ABC transport system permease protein|nr:ABC transporter permease [Fusobacteriaceae bacterium]